MDINYFVLAGIIMRILGELGLLVYVLPVQLREVVRPKNEFTRLRWFLLIFVLLYVVLNAFPLLYSFTNRLFSPSDFSIQNLTTLVANVANVSLTAVLILIYRYNRKA